MKRTGIIGAGHAGIKAAEVLAAAGQEVVVFSAEGVLPYYRPRIIALAFGQVELDAITIHPKQWYAEKGIDLRLRQPVTGLDVATKTVVTESGSETFDSLIITMGAGPFVPPIVQGNPERVLPLWSAEHAQAIHSFTPSGSRLVIIGGGILGLEAALRATEAGVNVTVVEMMPRLLPVQFGEKASALLQQQLEQRGIEVWTDCAVQRVFPVEDDTLQVQTKDGKEQITDCVVMSVGARRASGLAGDAGVKIQRGILVDEHLQSSEADVWAAGDIIEIEGLNRCSALDANMQGRMAAMNLLHKQNGEPQDVYKPTSAAVNFKLGTFEIHSVGRVATEGDRETAKKDEADQLIVLVHDAADQLVGAQMIGTAEGFKKICDDLGA